MRTKIQPSKLPIIRCPHSRCFTENLQIGVDSRCSIMITKIHRYLPGYRCSHGIMGEYHYSISCYKCEMNNGFIEGILYPEDAGTNIAGKYGGLTFCTSIYRNIDSGIGVDKLIVKNIHGSILLLLPKTLTIDEFAEQFSVLLITLCKEIKNNIKAGMIEMNVDLIIPVQRIKRAN
jgi:hypothetical protein